MAGKLFSAARIEFMINTQNALQQLNTFQQRFSNGMSQMKSLMVGFIGFQGLRGAYNSLTNLANLAKKWEMPVERLSRFTNLFAQFSGSIDDAAQSMDALQNLEKNLQLFSDTGARQLAARLRINLNNKDFMGAIEALRSQYPHLTTNAKVAVEEAVNANTALRNMLRASNAEMAKARENAEQMKVLSNEEGQAILNMEQKFAELKTTLTMAMVPVLEAIKPLVDLLSDVANAFNKLDESTKKSITYGFLGYEVLKHLGLLKLGFESIGGALASLGTLGGLAAIVAFGPGLADAAEKLTEVAKGTKTLAEAMDELAAREDVFGRVMKKFERLGEIVGNLWTKLGSMWSQVKITLGFGDAGDAAKVLADQRKLYEAGAISPEEFNATQQKMQSIMTANIPRIPKNQGFIPYANADQARLTFKGMPANVTQNINIYGVANAEDAVGQFRTIAEQTLTPLMGPQG